MVTYNCIILALKLKKKALCILEFHHISSQRLVFISLGRFCSINLGLTWTKITNFSEGTFICSLFHLATSSYRQLLTEYGMWEKEFSLCPSFLGNHFSSSKPPRFLEGGSKNSALLGVLTLLSNEFTHEYIVCNF